jgi:hypothetical protein
MNTSSVAEGTIPPVQVVPSVQLPLADEVICAAAARGRTAATNSDRITIVVFFIVNYLRHESGMFTSVSFLS